MAEVISPKTESIFSSFKKTYVPPLIEEKQVAPVVAPVATSAVAPAPAGAKSTLTMYKEETALQKQVDEEVSTDPLPIKPQMPAGYRVDPSNPDQAIPQRSVMTRGGMAPPVNPEDAIELTIPEEVDYDTANLLRAQGLVPNPEEELKAKESIVFGMVQTLNLQSQGAVMAEVLKLPTKVINGNLYRQVSHTDGSLRWGLMNEDGFTGEDIGEVFSGEVLPMLFSFLGVVSGFGYDKVTDPFGKVKKGVVGKVAKGSMVLAGDTVGSYAGYVANLLIVKEAYDLDEEALPMETIFFGGAREEALVGLATQIGLSATITSVATIYKLATGKHIPASMVDHLSEKLDEYDTILDTVIKPVQKGLDEPLINPTPGQATGDVILLSLEHQNASAMSTPSADTIVTDPYSLKETIDGLLKGVEGWFSKKYNSADPDLNLPAVEDLVQKAVKKDMDDLMTDLTTKQDFARDLVQTRLDNIGKDFTNTQEFVATLRNSAEGARNEVKEMFDLAYTELGSSYKGLRGPDHFIQSAKNMLEAGQALILEKKLSIGANKFLTKGTKAVPSQVSYEAVDATLKLIRSEIRSIKTDGRMANGPSLKSLYTMEEAYKLQRLSIARQAPDGGQSIARLDASYYTAMDAVDNDVVRRLLEPGLHGKFKVDPDEIMKTLFTPNTSGFESISSDIMTKYIKALREDPLMLADFRGAFGNKFSKSVKNPEDYKAFLEEYKGTINDLYGEVPESISDLKALIDNQALADLEVGNLQKVINADPFLKGSFAGRIKQILKDGRPEDLARLDGILAKNEDLKNMFVSTYLSDAIIGGTKGFPGIIQESIDGSLRFNVAGLTKLLGTLASDNPKAQDVIVRKFMPEDQIDFLKIVLDVAQMTNRGGHVSKAAHYDKTPIAHFAQLMFGPLSKNTRITNSADKYMQISAARALTEVMGDPQAMRILLNKYKTPSEVYQGARRSLYALSGRVLLGDDNPYKPASPMTPQIHAPEYSIPSTIDFQEPLEEEVDPKVITPQPSDDVPATLQGGEANLQGGVSGRKDGTVPNFVKRYMNPSSSGSIDNNDGTISTHRMASGELDGKGIAYPIIAEIDGALVDLGDSLAQGFAIKTGEYLMFDTVDEAEAYASGGYKALWGAGEKESEEVDPQASVSPPAASSPKPKVASRPITKMPPVASVKVPGATTSNALSAKGVTDGKSIIESSKKRATSVT